MAPDKTVNEWDELQSQVRFHRAMNAGLLGTLFFRALLLGFVVMCDTTKIVPPEVKRPYEVGSNYTNKDHLLDMAGRVLGTMLTITPEAVDYNNKVILKMADPDGCAGLKTTLDVAVIRPKQKRVTTIWTPHKEEVSEQDKRVKVGGKLETFTTDRLTSEREKDYLVEFTITTSGRLYVSKIEKIVGRGSSANKPAGN